ncbi:MAG: helix-turn-helix domain-containing protein [Desulfovibrionaceae bacterium]|nr:helix-turn-helix domain-containing protein [Desulfovibrionaceae bacterium]
MNWLSVAEIAKLTRIPAPTARRYASLFKDFLGGRKMGRVTRYPEESVVVFERISTLYADGCVTAEIDDRLRTEFPRTIDVEHRVATPAPQAEGYADLAHTFNGVIEKVAACMAVMADQKSIIDSQQDDIRKLKTAFVLLARSQKRLKQLPAGTDALPGEILEQTRALEQKDAEIEEMALKLSFDTSDIKAKLQILESELVRLRKDRRDMEKYLQDKIDRLKESV